jgi:endonuclease/exonuclease/phosphatase (EEP) superfamily protein YafD
MNKYKKIVLICLLILTLLSIVRYINREDYWIVDIFSQFPVQYALCALLLLVVCLWKKTTSLAVFAAFLFVFNISVLSDIGKFAQAAVEKNKTFKVYSANINKFNNDYKKLVGGLMQTDADVLLLLEVTERNIKPLEVLIERYPYRVVNLNIESSGTGIVLMSKFAILHHNITVYSDFGNMMVAAILEIMDKKLAFYATHFPRPEFIPDFSDRSIQFISLARQINGQSLPVIVAGDLNATPYSPIFRSFLDVSGLKDSREGFGWQPSWPAYFPLLWLPIDHILVSPEIQVHNRSTGPYIGSDHFPVFAELSMGH